MGSIFINIRILYYIKKKGGIKIPPFNLKIKSKDYLKSLAFFVVTN
jgi:hypothetical protein